MTAWQAISVGDELPPVSIDVTATVIVAGAIATRDFMPVHHDRDYANAQRAPDIFMNILSTNGFVGRFVTDWAGPNALIKKVSIRLGVPNYPGDIMRISGRVTAIESGVATVEVVGANSMGNHVTGTVEVEVP